MPTKKGYNTHRIDISKKQSMILGNRGGSLSSHIEEALDLYIDYRFSVYKITDLSTNKFFIDYYDYLDEAQDLGWHYVHTRGPNSVGKAIRDREMMGFHFTVIARCDNEKKAEAMRKLLVDYYKMVKGYDCWDL